MNMKKERARRVVKFIVLAILLIPLFGFIVMLLWNWLMPTLFGLPQIGFWQAWGLFLLSKILFGGFRGQPGRSPPWPSARALGNHVSEEREAFRRGVCHRSIDPASPDTDAHSGNAWLKWTVLQAGANTLRVRAATRDVVRTSCRDVPAISDPARHSWRRRAA